MTTNPSIPAAMRGAIDLGALAAARDAQEKAQQRAEERRAGGAPLPVSVDVTEASFQVDVIEASYTVPVVIDLWATWCEPCKALSPVLEKLATDFDGKFILAKVDIDANPRIAQAFQVQSIPSVIAVLAGQPLPLFQGALPEASVRQVLDELLRVAAENGVTGGLPADADADGEGEAEVVATPEELALERAEEFVHRNDYPAAMAAFDEVLSARPMDVQARTGRAYAEVMTRAQGADESAVSSALDDVSGTAAAADLLFAQGQFETAFSRLIATVAATSGADRTQARDHLLSLFAALGDDDERVVKARMSLANALF